MPETLPIHPITGLRAIGFTSRGPIWPVLGGSEDAGTPPPEDPGTADSGDKGTESEAPQGDDAKTGEKPAEKTFSADYVKQLRDEAAGRRTEVQQLRATLDGIAKALDPDAGDEKPDPAKLAEQLTAKDNELRTLRVERAAEQAARKAGADADALLDSRAFAESLGQLDPTDKGFVAALDALVAETLKARPQYRASGQAPARSGAPIPGGSGGAKKPTTLTDAVAARLGAG